MTPQQFADYDPSQDFLLPAGFTAVRNGRVTLAPIEDATQGTRTVDPEGDVVTTARYVGLQFGDR